MELQIGINLSTRVKIVQQQRLMKLEQKNTSRSELFVIHQRQLKQGNDCSGNINRNIANVRWR